MRKKACCPIDTMPPYPASRFHIIAKTRYEASCTKSCNASRPAHHGALATASAINSKTSTMTRLALVARRTSKLAEAAGRFNSVFMSKPLCGFGQQALRPYHQHGEEHDMPQPDAPTGIEVKACLLRDAQCHAAKKRAPERPHATDDHSLERVQEQSGT